MPPFQEFRRWCQQARRSERVTAAVASAAVVGVLLWTVVPSTVAGAGSPANGAVMTAVGAPAVSSQNEAVSGAAPTGATPMAVGGPTAAAAGQEPAGGGGAGMTGGAGPTAAGPAVAGGALGRGCTSPPGSAPGVTATQIKVAVTLINIAGAAGNQTFGLNSPADQQKYFQEIVDATNASGGVACRRLVPEFYQVNPADQSDMQQKCLDIVHSGAFALLDAGGETVSPGPACFGQNRFPDFDGPNLLWADEVARYYPYLFATFDIRDSLYRNTIFALRDRGFFSAADGFHKLGFVYLDCDSAGISGMMRWLHQAGLSDTQIVTYDVGCPSTSIANPSDLEQAVLKFKQAGVTHVTAGYFAGSFSNFTTLAQQQGFKPKYGLGDDAILAVSYGGQHPDYNNIAGAIAITASRYGEERTPGMRPTPGTAKCDAILEAHGQAATYRQYGQVGTMCDEIWMFKAAVEHAPVISRESLAAGLQAAKSVDFSYPYGPNDFSGRHVTWAGQYWRTAEFLSSCTCWRVIDAKFHPSYP